MNRAYRDNYKAIDWSDLPAPPPRCETTVAAAVRSHLPAPMLIRDGMEPVRSMLDGKMYDSKARLRATYRAAGVTELGNDAPTAPTPRPRTRVKRSEIEASVGRAFSRAGLGA